MPEPIFVITTSGQKIRCLGPYEHDAIMANIETDYLKTLFEICFWTGMRYTEIQYLYHNPDFIVKEDQIIIITSEEKNKHRVTPERFIAIPPQINEILSEFSNNTAPPSNKVWREDLRRWAHQSGVGEEGISPKTTRVSIETWLIIAGVSQKIICKRQGYSTSRIRKYPEILFTEEEKAEIKDRLHGWVELR